MRNVIGWWGLIALVALCGFALIACDDGVDELAGDGLLLEIDPVALLGGNSVDPLKLSTYKYDITIPPTEKPSYISQLIKYSWGIPSSPGYDFKWCFFNDGTIPLVHCCGYMEKNEGYRFLLAGNVLLTAFGTIKVDYITMADDYSYFKWNGSTYPRREPTHYSFAALTSMPLRITNATNLLGAWQGDGQQFTFTDDSELRIGADLYGYLVLSKTEFLTLGPIANGKTAGLEKYKYIRDKNKEGEPILRLRRASDDAHYELGLD